MADEQLALLGIEAESIIKFLDLDADIGDEMLGIMFIACHPFPPPEARVALTIRLIGRLKTEEIARAFLVSKRAMTQHIDRAKRGFANAHLAFELPQGTEHPEHQPSVLEVFYLIFNEGYSTTKVEDWIRSKPCNEALWLGHILAGLAPSESKFTASFC